MEKPISVPAIGGGTLGEHSVGRRETMPGSALVASVDSYLPFVLVAVVVVVFGSVIIQKVRTDRQMEPTRQRVLADPVVRTFSEIRVQLNPGTQRSGFLKGGSELTVRSRSFDFGLAAPFRGAFRYYFIAEETEMRAAELRFGNTRTRHCILIAGKHGGKQMDAAVAAEGQLAEMWMFLASAGVQPMSEVPGELL
jgi:hypothetical protein